MFRMGSGWSGDVLEGEKELRADEKEFAEYMNKFYGPDTHWLIVPPVLPVARKVAIRRQSQEDHA